MTEESFPPPFLPTLAFSNHDRIRRISTLKGNENLYKMSLLLQATTRGIPCFYNGEEIGLPQARLSHKDSLDAVCTPFKKLPKPLFRLINSILHSSIHRDECRTPIPWTPAPNGGFCPPGTVPWLPLQADFQKINIESQEKDPESTLQWFRKLITLRNSSQSLQTGKMEVLERFINGRRLPKKLLAYRRGIENQETSLEIYMNWGTKPIDLGKNLIGGKVLLRTAHPDEKENRLLLPKETGIVIKL